MQMGAVTVSTTGQVLAIYHRRFPIMSYPHTPGNWIARLKGFPVELTSGTVADGMWRRNSRTTAESRGLKEAVRVIQWYPHLIRRHVRRQVKPNGAIRVKKHWHFLSSSHLFICTRKLLGAPLMTRRAPDCRTYSAGFNAANLFVLSMYCP